MMYPAPSVGQDPDRACRMDDPYLDASEGHPDYPEFHYNHQNYRVEIVGLAVPDPRIIHSPYRICRRYELNNVSGKEIVELRWPDIGVGHISSVPAGERFRWPRHVPSNSQHVGTSTTTLYAWENTPAQGITVFPMTVRRGDAQTDALVYAHDTHGLPYELMQTSPATLVLDASHSFGEPREKSEFPTLESGFYMGDISLSIVSSATFFPDDSYVETIVEVSGTWDRDGEAAILAPGLSSFEYAPNAQDKVLALARYIEEDQRISAESGFTHTFDLSFAPENSANEPLMFMVEQPVTLMIGDWAACILAPIYSQVPISLSNNACGSPN